MRSKALLLAVAGLTGLSGCLGDGTGRNMDMIGNIRRNFVEAPFIWSDEVVMARRDRKRAEEAWEEISRECPGRYSDDYGDGFRLGYYDFLDAGGTGEPPPVPPFKYRRPRYQTPEGMQAIEDWYNGFRHGAQAARSSGYRNTIVLPLSSPPINAVSRPVNNPPPDPKSNEPSRLPEPKPEEKTESLPAPRPLPDNELPAKENP